MKKELTQDWDYAEEYYQTNGESEGLTLADFMEDSVKERVGTQEEGTRGKGESEKGGLEAGGIEEGEKQKGQEKQTELQKITRFVEQVTALSVQGKTVAFIAEELGLTEQYVKDILICVQSFPEDNPVAVARLMMG